MNTGELRASSEFPAAMERFGDLRRRYHRELIRELTERAAWLSTSDRALIEAVFREGRSVSRVAADTGEPVRMLRRRVKTLVRRLKSSRFKFVVSQQRQWPSVKRRVAHLCIIEGKSQRAAARELRLSLHAVRRQYQAVEALYEAAAGGGAESGARGARR